MDLILTGRTMDAAEAERSGLVARVVAADRLVDEAMETGRKIAGLSPLAVAMAKELVDAAQDTTLSAGLALERRLFHSLFAFDDQKEGMAAFVAKRKPEFKGR
jgi:enoyl-CoA hydratase/carnithine racemase